VRGHNIALGAPISNKKAVPPLRDVFHPDFEKCAFPDGPNHFICWLSADSAKSR
jgi:hypothetical protein